MDESFFGEGTDSWPCILITSGNFQSNLVPVYFLNSCGVRLLARNQPHYCSGGNCNHYLHNSSGQSFLWQNTLLYWWDRVFVEEKCPLFTSQRITFCLSFKRHNNNIIILKDLQWDCCTNGTFTWRQLWLRSSHGSIPIPAVCISKCPWTKYWRHWMVGKTIKALYKCRPFSIYSSP